MSSEIAYWLSARGLKNCNDHMLNSALSWAWICVKTHGLLPMGKHDSGIIDIIGIPSGKHTKNYGKSPCLMGKSPLFMGKSPFLIGKSPFWKGKSTINGKIAGFDGSTCAVHLDLLLEMMAPVWCFLATIGDSKFPICPSGVMGVSENRLNP